MSLDGWGDGTREEIAALFDDERLEWSPKNLSVFRRVVRPVKPEPRQAPTRATWAGAALLISRSGKVDHRVEALKLLANGVSIRRVAKLLSVDDKTVRRWVHAARAAA